MARYTQITCHSCLGLICEVRNSSDRASGLRTYARNRLTLLWAPNMLRVLQETVAVQQGNKFKNNRCIAHPSLPTYCTLASPYIQKAGQAPQAIGACFASRNLRWISMGISSKNNKPPNQQVCYTLTNALMSDLDSDLGKSYFTMQILTERHGRDRERRGHLWTTRSTFGIYGTTVPLRRWRFFCRWRRMMKSARKSCWAHNSSRTSTFFNRIKHRVVKHKGFSTSLSNCTVCLIVCSYLEVIPMLLLRSASWMQMIQLRHCFAALCTTQNLRAAAFFPSRLAIMLKNHSSHSCALWLAKAPKCTTPRISQSIPLIPKQHRFKSPWNHTHCLCWFHANVDAVKRCRNQTWRDLPCPKFDVETILDDPTLTTCFLKRGIVHLSESLSNCQVLSLNRLSKLFLRPERFHALDRDHHKRTNVQRNHHLHETIRDVCPLKPVKARGIWDGDRHKSA